MTPEREEQVRAASRARIRRHIVSADTRGHFEAERRYERPPHNHADYLTWAEGCEACAEARAT